MRTSLKNKTSYFLAISFFVLMVANMACTGHTKTAISMPIDSHMEITGQMLLDP